MTILKRFLRLLYQTNMIKQPCVMNAVLVIMRIFDFITILLRPVIIMIRMMLMVIVKAIMVVTMMVL